MREVYLPLDATGARLFGGCFNPMGLPALYLSQDPDLALMESTGALGWTGHETFAPRRIVSVRLLLRVVIDLVDGVTLEAVGLEEQDLVGPWATLGAPCRTQLFGERAAAEGAEALKYPSALDRARHSIVVFPENLHLGSSIDVTGDDE